MSPTHPTCRRCGRKFVSDGRLANHIEVVHNVKRCESCKRFIGKNGNHACEAPAVKKAYSCFANNCSYSSNKKGNMMRHWRTNHSEEGKETIKRIAASAEKEERRLSGQKKLRRRKERGELLVRNQVPPLIRRLELARKSFKGRDRSVSAFEAFSG